MGGFCEKEVRRFPLEITKKLGCWPMERVNQLENESHGVIPGQRQKGHGDGVPYTWKLSSTHYTCDQKVLFSVCQCKSLLCMQVKLNFDFTCTKEYVTLISFFFVWVINKMLRVSFILLKLFHCEALYLLHGAAILSFAGSMSYQVPLPDANHAGSTCSPHTMRWWSGFFICYDFSPEERPSNSLEQTQDSC